jgi:hypothetical protein
MNKYNNSKIYIITSPDTDKVYIGSTTNDLDKRLRDHVNSYTAYLKDKREYITSYELVKQNSYVITELEFVNVETEEQLKERERYYIENTPNCVNKQIPGRTKEEIKEYAKKYREEHPEEIKAKRDEKKDEKSKYNKKYREENNEVIKEKEKISRINRKDKIKAYNNDYYLREKAKIVAQKSQRIECSCGNSYTLNHKSDHEKTAKHLKGIQNNKIA